MKIFSVSSFPNWNFRLTGLKRSCPEEVLTKPAKLRPRNEEAVSLLACQRDSRAGFFIEEEQEVDGDEASAAAYLSSLVDDLPPPILGADDGEQCDDCHKEFDGSFLSRNFDVLVCDNCKGEERHSLCTKTEAKQKYLLKDCDLDLRTPVLRYVLRKNPHNDRWGQMKLYYRPHVVARALEIWESIEKIEDEKEKRVDNKEKTKQKKFEKRIKELRRAVRTSTWQKSDKVHVHDYDSENEIYNEQDDEYSKTCKICSHVLTYEKM